ncbi:MAG: tetratricopeptide repeat protein [Planctomycetaceae bacterium]
MASKRMRPGRAVLLVLLGLTVVAGGSYAAYRVYLRGKHREGVFERAQRALREENREEGETLLRQLLASEPKHRAARELLAALLLQAQRYEEAKAFLEESLAQTPGDVAVMTHLVETMMRLGQAPEAVRLAHRVADAHPEFSLRVLRDIADASVNLQLRQEALEFALALSTVTQSQSVRAEALLFAATTRLDLSLGFVPEARALAQLQARGELTRADTAAKLARQTRENPHVDLLRSAVQAFSENEVEAATAARDLRIATETESTARFATSILAHYHALHGEWVEAVRYAGLLRDGAPHLWLRAVQRLAALDRRADALELLREPEEGEPVRTLCLVLKAELLFRGQTPGEKAEAVAILEERIPFLAKAQDLALTGAALAWAHGESALGLRILDSARAANPGWRLDLLTLGLNRGRENGPDSASLAGGLASKVDSLEESLQVVRILAGQGYESALSYLDAKIAAGGPEATDHRVWRAHLKARRSLTVEDAEASRSLIAQAVEDVRACASDAAASRRSLVLAHEAARAVGDHELAGWCLGRAATGSGLPDLPEAIVLAAAQALPGLPARTAFATGLRRAAADVPARALLEVLAAAIARAATDYPALLEALKGIRADAGSSQLALRLGVRVAQHIREFDTARTLALELVATGGTAEEQSRNRVLLGEIHFQRQEWEEIVGLHGDPALRSMEATAQVVESLIKLKREDAALAAAKEFLERHPESALAHTMAARVYMQRKQDREALALLSISPPSRTNAILRGEILIRLQEWDVAHALYLGLLVQSNLGDETAWERLREVMAGARREGEFLEITQQALKAPSVQKLPLVAGQLHSLRARTLEDAGRMMEAIAAYEQAILLNDEDWVSLNNLAWRLATNSPDRVADALGFIQRALALRPKHAKLHDTAAEVLSLAKEWQTALEHMEQALAGAGPHPPYLLRKAKLLMRLDRDEQSRAILLELRTGNPESAEANEAAELLRTLDERKAERN